MSRASFDWTKAAEAHRALGEPYLGKLCPGVGLNGAVVTS
jgi:hypothetical protein